MLVADEAEARVCGQSGVAPKCPTYDCDETWGWCWYARGCCAGGGLKKICDCCAPIRAVHGYCPSGTNVKCIVESCGTDPRVQIAELTDLRHDNPIALSVAASRWANVAGSAPAVVLVDAARPLVAAVAASLGPPVLLVDGNGVGASVLAELQRLGTRTARLVGQGIGPNVETGIRSYGIAVERLGANISVEQLSLEVAAARRTAGARRAICIVPTGLSATAAPLAGWLAARSGQPLLVGSDAARRHAAETTYLVGPEARAAGGALPGAAPLLADTIESLAIELADVGRTHEGLSHPTIALLSSAALGSAAALVRAGAAVLVHEPGGVATVRDWLFANRDPIRRMALGGASGALTSDSRYELQSLVNGFDAHNLIGVAGQGLPVIDQPQEERPLGLARIR